MTREELSAWIDENAPEELWDTASIHSQGHRGGTKADFPSEAHRVWFERCLARGWTAPTWPTEYGVPKGIAHPIEGGYRVSGQTIWTRDAERSDWMVCLVRTSLDQHAGITLVIFPMDDRGISVRTLELISGPSPFYDVRFDGLFVPDENVIGPVGDGWRLAKALLRHERGMVSESTAAGGARLPELMDWTLRKAFLEYGDEDPLLRDAVARWEMDQEAMRLTVKRSNDSPKAGSRPGEESSIFKLLGSELNQRRWELGVALTGNEALLWEHPLGRQWLRSRGDSIEGGTSEVQRNILARRVLGLPKP